MGRHTEVAAVSAFLDAVPAGGGALLIEGDAGIGKTTIWRAGIAAAAARGYQVLACQPAEAEARLSYAAMADLLDPVLGDTLPQLPVVQRRALEIALLRAEADAPADERAVAVAFLSTLRGVAESAAVLVAVDDWQWLDGPSARVLQFALRRLDDEPVGVLGSVRTGPSVAVGATLERDLGQARLTRLGLEPLTLAALHQLLTTQMGITLPRRTLLQLQTATAGNAFFALEIARVLAARPKPLPPGERLPVPATIHELVTERVAELPVATREVLLAASALAQPTIELLQAVDGQWRPGKVLAAAERAELVALEGDRLRFSHPLIAAAVYANATLERTRTLHRRLAQVITEPEERARHLALATEGPSHTTAAALEEAAASARARGAPDAAAELCELAAAATPPDQPHAHRRRCIDAAEHHFVAGDHQRARLLLEKVLTDSPPGRERAQVLRLLGVMRYHHDSFPEAGRLLRLALTEAGQDPAMQAEINYDLAYVTHASERVPVAAEHAHAALAAAEQHAEPGLLAEVLAVVTAIDFLLGRGLDTQRLQRALTLEETARRVPAPVRPSLIHGMLMTLVGRPGPARASLEGLRARLVEHGDEAGLPFVAFALSWDACVRGDLAAAERHSQEGLEAAARVGTDVLRAFALTATAYAEAYLGRTDPAHAAAEEAVALFARVGCPRWAAWPRSVLGFVHLSVNDAAAAAGVLRPLVRSLPLAGVQDPVAVPFVPDAAQALITLGEVEAAASLLDWFEERGRALDRPWTLATGRRCRGLLRAAHGDLAGALETLGQALRIHQRLPHPIELARTLLVLGQLQRRANQRRQARDTLEQARLIFEEVGAAQWSRQAAAELTRLGLHRTAGPGLTPRERQVAEHAAAGATNNQIAQALSISPKTVEANLARAYHKLGIRSRAQLGGWMASQPRGQEPAT